MFNCGDMKIFDVQELPTHGGSLRIYVSHPDNPPNPMAESCMLLQERECAAGLDKLETYSSFEGRVKQAKRDLLQFLIQAKSEGKRIAAYGAPAKGNTLLVYLGVPPAFFDFMFSRNPHNLG